MTQIASVGASLDNVATWLRSVWTAPLAPLHRTGPASLLPTCFAVLACECCGVLEQLPAELRSATADYLLRQQSAQSGLFELGSIERKDLTSHSASYLRLQATYFAVHALDALGYQAPYTLPLVDRLLSREYAWGWLDGGPWHDPWLHSNTIMFALSFLQVEHDRNPGKGYLRASTGFSTISTHVRIPARDSGSGTSGAMMPMRSSLRITFFRFTSGAGAARIIPSASSTRLWRYSSRTASSRQPGAEPARTWTRSIPSS